MELNDKEVRAVAETRLRANKKLNWNRKYTIPSAIFLSIAIVSALVLLSLPKLPMMFVSNQGVPIVLSDNVTAFSIGDITYTRDKAQEKDVIREVVTGVGGMSIILGYGISVLWKQKVKKPYISEFIKYWQEHKELPS